MTIAFDISALDPDFKEHATRGIGRYVRELKKYFDQYESEINYFDHRKLISDSRLAQLISYLPAGRVTLQQQLLYPFKLSSKLKNYNYLHFCAQMDAPSWCPKKYLLTVHDIIPLVLADLYKAAQPGWRFELARKLELAAIKNASLIFTNSECTKRDLNRILNISNDRMVVTPLGVDQKFFKINHKKNLELLTRFNISNQQKLLLYVGGLDPRKNYSALLEVLFNLKLKNFNSKLIMIGNIAGNKTYPNFKALVKKLDLEQDVIETGFLSDEDLLDFYAAADLFLFPSLYEGFGLPPLEAMAAGLPVISSNTSAMPEVLGDAAIMLDPKDVSGMLEACVKIFTDSNYSQQLRLAGRKRAQLFTWENTAKLTLDVYRSLEN